MPQDAATGESGESGESGERKGPDGGHWGGGSRGGGRRGDGSRDGGHRGGGHWGGGHWGGGHWGGGSRGGGHWGGGSQGGGHQGGGHRGDGSQGGSHWKGGLYPPARAGYIEYDRVLFFSDAVFAIAITLLAVSLRVPDHPITNTGHVLHQAVPSLAGFGISFAVIGLFWLGHHGIFRYITAFDRPLIALNLLFLGTIAFLPYPTELLSRESISNQPGIIVFYAICVSAAGIAELAVWLHATNPARGLSGAEAGQVRLPFLLRIGRVPVVFGLSIPVALVAPTIAPYTWIAVWVIGVVASRMAPGRRGRVRAEA